MRDGMWILEAPLKLKGRRKMERRIESKCFNGCFVPSSFLKDLEWDAHMDLIGTKKLPQIFL